MSKRNGTKAIKRLMGALLIAMLLANAAAGLVSAEETVTGVSLEGPTTSPIALTVEDGNVSLSLIATIQGSSTPKNVTTEAVWTSSSSAVKVDKGVLWATGEALATITAKYKTFTATATVRSEYLYASLKLKTSGADAGDQLNIDMDESLTLDAFRIENNGAEGESVKSSAQWMTSNASVATVTAGAVSFVNPGTVTITARYKGRSDAITLTVSSPYESLDISHDGTKVSAPIELNVGDPNYTLDAMATPKSTSTAVRVTDDAVWSTSNGSVVKVEDGVLTAVGAGSATVTAKRYGASDAVTVYVRTPYEAMKVTSAKPLSVTLYGAPMELSATVAKGSEAPVDISTTASWQMSDPMVAVVDLSTPGKVFVKPKGVGSTRLTATYKGLSKDLTVTVFPSVSSVEISKDRLDLFEGDSGTLPAVKGTNVGGDTMDVSKLVVWKSSDESIVSIADGKWQAMKAGSVTLTAEAENEPNQPKKTDTLQVEVHKKLLALIADKTNVSIVTGSEADLPKVNLIYTDGDDLDVSGNIAWKTSSPNLLIKSGKMKGLLPGSMTLTGTYLNKTVTVKVQVEEKFTTFDIQPKSLPLTLNRSQSIRVTGVTVSGKKVTLSSRISWKASADHLVEIRGGSVKGLAEGSGKLIGSVQGNNLEIPFTVKARLSKLTVSDSSLTLKTGESDTVKITAVYEGGKTVDVTNSAVWTSTNRKVATADDGVVKAVAKGSASIKAAFEGKTISIRVSVK